jgi:hypothetical protein
MHRRAPAPLSGMGVIHDMQTEYLPVAKSHGAIGPVLRCAMPWAKETASPGSEREYSQAQLYHHAQS